MTFVITQPELLTAAANLLDAIGDAVAAQNAAAATPTQGVVPAASDEVSALTATRFAAQAALYQEVGAQAAAIHGFFVQILRANASSYSETEAANTIATG